ncbi:MAG TPA: YetF domain-containing protein [Thermoanaerobaculia bacterium]|nr:YetF domain-containing protein [Thermoanaerobaculia bacterium]
MHAIFPISQMLHDMFTFSIPVAEKMMRPIIVYAFLVLLLRVFGKRELAQLNPFDLVVLLSLSNTVQNAIIGDDNSVAGGLIGAFTLLLTNYLVVRFLFGHRRLDQIIEGKPTTLVRDGEVLKSELAKELITESELSSVARRQGFDGVSDIQDCVLEPGGVFVIKRKTPSDDEVKHQELLARLDHLTAQLESLQQRVGK